MAFAKEVLIITGCSGRTGVRVAHQFADPRFLVVGLDKVAPKISSSNFEYIACDITNPHELHQAETRIRSKYGNKIASFIHLIPEGTSNIISMALGFDTEQCIYASSVLVNVPCEPGQRINEYWPVGPMWDYPKRLLAAEDIVRKQHGTIPFVILRRSCSYDDMCHHLPLAQQIQRIYEQQTAAIFFPGNPTHGSSYIHYEDVADIVWLTVERRLSLPKELIFVASEKDMVSYEELQKIIGLQCHGEECQTWAIPKWLAKYAIRMSEKFSFLPKTDIKEWMVDIADCNYACNTSLIQEKLGWAPRHSFRQTLPKMLSSLKENPMAWYRENGLTFPQKE